MKLPDDCGEPRVIDYPVVSALGEHVDDVPHEAHRQPSAAAIGIPADTAPAQASVGKDEASSQGLLVILRERRAINERYLFIGQQLQTSPLPI